MERFPQGGTDPIPRENAQHLYNLSLPVIGHVSHATSPLASANRRDRLIDCFLWRSTGLSGSAPPLGASDDDPARAKQQGHADGASAQVRKPECQDHGQDLLDGQVLEERDGAVVDDAEHTADEETSKFRSWRLVRCSTSMAR